MSNVVVSVKVDGNKFAACDPNDVLPVANLPVSAQSGNALQKKSDGLFVPAQANDGSVLHDFVFSFGNLDLSEDSWMFKVGETDINAPDGSYKIGFGTASFTINGQAVPFDLQFSQDIAIFRIASNKCTNSGPIFSFGAFFSTASGNPLTMRGHAMGSGLFLNKSMPYPPEGDNPDPSTIVCTVRLKLTPLGN